MSTRKRRNIRTPELRANLVEPKMTQPKRVPGQPARIQQAILLIVQGTELKEAAEKARMEPGYLRTMLKLPQYQERIAEVRAEWRWSLKDVLFRKIAELAGVIDGVPPAEDQKTQLNAALRLMGMMGESLEQTVTESRVAAESKRWREVEERRRQIGSVGTRYAVPTLHTILHVEREPERVIEHQEGKEGQEEKSA